MAKTITKRDGRVVDFDRTKIAQAVLKAMEGVDKAPEIADEIAVAVESQCEENETVESVQDKVEKELINKGLAEAAKAYILFRQHRTDVREQATKLMGILDTLFKGKSSSGSAHKENANINADSVSGTFYKIGSEASKSYYAHHMLPEDILKDCEEGWIYPHDRDYYGLSIN